MMSYRWLLVSLGAIAARGVFGNDSCSIIHEFYEQSLFFDLRVLPLFSFL